MKIIRVFESSCVEDVNLRSRIVTYAANDNTSGAAISAKHKDQLAVNDVKWSPGEQSTTIATAAANGQVVIYDLIRAGLETARLHEHNRQVHKLAFNPWRGTYLLSGSQDATVRLWDLRALADERSVITFGSVNRYSLNNEGIRDLKWSPRDVMEFAAGTDNGVIQRWDFRKNTSPLLKINAHEKTCHTIDWHPDGKHLASGGADKNLKVWDFASTDRRMKPCWQLRAPQAIREVRWRPSCSPAHRSGNMQCTQLAASYDHQDPRIHVWDFRRPCVTFREIDQYDTPATAMLWRSEDLLWTVGSAGMFTQSDVKYATKVLDHRSPNLVAFSPDGSLALFSEKRSYRRRSMEAAPNDFFEGQSAADGSGEKLSGSHDANPGSFEEARLPSSSFKSRQRRAASSRSSKSIASTPPSTNDGEAILKLDEALQKVYIHCPTQYAASGSILGIFDAEAFTFLARNYRFPPSKPIVGRQWHLHQMLAKIFEENAMLARCVGQYRLAQSWRVLGMAVEKELRATAERNRMIRLQHLPSGDSTQKEPPNKLDGGKSIRPLANLTDRVGLEKTFRKKLVASTVVENGSNVTTPLARPLTDLSSSVEKQRNIAILDDEESFRLPTPAFSKQFPRKPIPVSSDLTRMKNSMDTHEIEGFQADTLKPHQSDQPQHAQGQVPLATGFLDLDHHMNERRAAMNNYRAQPRPLLRLDDPFHITRDFLTPTLARHDSDESLQMFSASTDSSHRAASIGGSFGSNQDSERSGSRPGQVRSNTPEEESHNFDSHVNPDILLEGDQNHRGPEDSPPLNNTALGTLAPTSVPDEAKSSVSPAKLSALRRTDLQPPTIHSHDCLLADNDDGILLGDAASLEPGFILSDFASQTESKPLKPWTASAMLPQLIEYHTTTLSDTQMPAFLILYLAPYISLSIPPQLELSILISYHEQLTSLSLYCESAYLRNLVESTHPEVTEHGTYGITPGGPWCTVCRKPSKGDRDNFCERCKNAWAPCPICNGEGSIAPPHTEEPDIAYPQRADTLWSWCQGCGHGGHVGCLSVWWDDPTVSEGSCATIGCLHDCVSGIRRDEKIRKAAEDRRAGLVQGDDWVVGESRAVEKARDLIAGRSSRGVRRGQAESRGRSGGQGPLSAGLGGRSGSGSESLGKKVRLLVPEGEGEGQGAVQVEGEGRTSASAP